MDVHVYYKYRSNEADEWMFKFIKYRSSEAD